VNVISEVSSEDLKDGEECILSVLLEERANHCLCIYLNSENISSFPMSPHEDLLSVRPYTSLDDNDHLCTTLTRGYWAIWTRGLTVDNSTVILP